jgi:ATP-dependent helicase HrpB
MVGGRGVRLAPESVVRDAAFYVALDAREDRRGGTLELQVSLASMIRLEWLEELFPEQVHSERLTRYDPSRRRVVGTTRLWYHDLLLREDVNPSVDPHEARVLLAAAARPLAPEWFRGNAQAACWLARLDFARSALPERNWPEFNDDVLGQLLAMTCQGKTSFEELEQVDLIPLLQSRLTGAQIRELRESAPQSLEIPSGRQVRLVYEPGKAPILAARLQELFGWNETPRVARGRVPVLVHILGPNNRPVQITCDLHSFWATTYHQVRKDLRGRYPKHAWPEDPLQAKPTVKRKRP